MYSSSDYCIMFWSMSKTNIFHVLLLSLCVLFYFFPLPDSLLSLLHLGRLIKADWELKSWFPTLGSIQSAKNGCHSLCFGFSFAFFGFFPLFSPNFSLGGSARNGRRKTGTELTWQIWNPLVRIGFSYLVVGDLEGVIFTRLKSIFERSRTSAWLEMLWS